MKQACRAATRGRPLMSKKGTLPSVTKAGSTIKCMNLEKEKLLSIELQVIEFFGQPILMDLT